MYDWELANYLRDKNHNLSASEYIYVCNTCPQLRQISYDAYSNMFTAISDNNEYFRFKVYPNER